MLRHLNCMLGNRAVKSEADGAASTTELNQDAMSASMSVETTSVADISVVAANGDCPVSSPGPCGDAFAGLSYPIGLSGDLITLLPRGTGSVSLTFRLFSCFGKLLTHFEDDLELYPSADVVRSLVRDPIAFELPEVADSSQSQFNLNKPENKEQQQCNYCNNWQLESQQESNDKSERVIRVETPSVLTSSTISSLFSATANTDSVNKAKKRHNNVCYDFKCNFSFNRSDYYFGPIEGLHSNVTPPGPPSRAALTSLPRRLRVSRGGDGGSDDRRGLGRRQKLQHCCPLSPPMLLELDGLSGRTEALGCVPSVPVARSRLVTHRGRGGYGR